MMAEPTRVPAIMDDEVATRPEVPDVSRPATRLRTLPRPVLDDEDAPDIRLSAMVDTLVLHRYREAVALVCAAQGRLRDIRGVAGDTNGRATTADEVIADLDTALHLMREAVRKIVPPPTQDGGS